MKQLCLTLLVLLIGVVDSYPNDSAIQNVGGSIKSMDEHPTIELIAEHVHARIFPDSAIVECVFFLRNNGESTTVKMGFPNIANGAVGDDREPYQYFRSYVDSDEVSSECIGPDIHPVGGGYTYWWVKDVTFEASQVRVIRDVYHGGIGRNTEGKYFFNYTVRTGRSWAGAIGTASIVFSFEGFEPYAFEIISPSGYDIDTKEIRWTFHDYEPDLWAQDLSVWWILVEDNGS